LRLPKVVELPIWLNLSKAQYVPYIPPDLIITWRTTMIIFVPYLLEDMSKQLV